MSDNAFRKRVLIASYVKAMTGESPYKYRLPSMEAASPQWNYHRFRKKPKKR